MLPGNRSSTSFGGPLVLQLEIAVPRSRAPRSSMPMTSNVQIEARQCIAGMSL
jgi:hypothetical protein